MNFTAAAHLSAPPAAENPAPAMDPADLRLLDLLQQGLPLAPRPFAELGKSLNISETNCLARVRRLRLGDAVTGAPKVIRQISAIFDTTALGYRSALVAAKIAPEKLDAAAAVISSHPGVSHNYARDHAFNLWHTLAVPPDSLLGLEQTVEKLRELSGAESMRLLPTLRLFKIGVKFDLGAGGDGESAPSGAFTEADRAIAGQYRITPEEIQAIRVLQQDLPLVEEPFAAWAGEAGMGVADLLAAATRFKERRQMRRFAAVLHHRAAGVKANAMGVWAVPEAQVEEAGLRLARFAEVSHCYRRPTHPDWPYSVFTMVHARSREDALEALERMREAAGGAPMEALWTVCEFKKTRVTYFTPETRAWERAHLD